MMNHLNSTSHEAVRPFEEVKPDANSIHDVGTDDSPRTAEELEVYPQEEQSNRPTGEPNNSTQQVLPGSHSQSNDNHQLYVPHSEVRTDGGRDEFLAT